MSEMDVLNEIYVPAPYEVWGLFSLAPWKAALVKGEGRVPFDASVHKSMVWAIDLSVLPIDAMNAGPVERQMIQSSKEWAEVQKAIKDLGVEPSEINGKYVRASFEPTGETYVNRKGETKNKTFLKIAKVFDTEDDCTKDYLYVSEDEKPQEEEEPGNLPAGQKEYEAAYKLLQATVRSAARGKKTVEEVKTAADPRIKGSPVMAKFFDVDGVEFGALAEKELAGA